jgi:FecR protein/Putative zinc-finger
MFSNHVTRNFSAYCNDELSAEESLRFNEHVMACAKCRAQLDDIKLGVKFAEQLPSFSAPENLWSNVETKLGTAPTRNYLGSGFGTWRFQVAAVAAGLLIVATLGIWLLRSRQTQVHDSPSWEVQLIDGTLRVGESSVANKGKMRVGEWVETGKDSNAQINVASIGRVEIGPDTKVRLLQTQPTEHRIELARGKMSAHIWAPPRLFFVDTPSAVAADLGCAYTLEVNGSGASLLRVTVGWVALQLKDRESMVPAGAACETRPGIGPGTPYFEDAAPEFRASLTKIDFDNDSASTNSALDVMLNHTRKRDTLTLWHLLGRVDETQRSKVYDKIASFVPPPAGVTRDGILSLDQKMLDLWRDKVEPTWAVNKTIPKEVAEAYWRVKNGVSRNANDPQKKLMPVVP